MTRLLRIGLALLVLASPLGALAAENLTADQIVAALTPGDNATRGLKVKTAEPGAAPSIDLRLQFAADSDALETEAVLSLRTLAAALSDTRLESYRFEIIGHADDTGTKAHRMGLSERRAAAVVDQLVKVHHVDRTRLRATGKGASEPLDAIAGWVEIVNIGQ